MQVRWINGYDIRYKSIPIYSRVIHRWINGYDIRYKSIPIYSRVIHADWHVGNSDTLPVKYASGGKFADYDCSIQDIGDLDTAYHTDPTRNWTRGIGNRCGETGRLPLHENLTLQPQDGD